MSEKEQPIRVPKSFRIIAHRGASGYAPENTMAAFQRAKDMNVIEVELDIQFSTDKHMMICHDPELSRYGHPGLQLSELTRKELQALDLGAWFNGGNFAGEKMLTLEELFEAFSTQFTYHVEIKTPAPGLAAAIIDCIDNHQLSAQTFITSFHFDALTEVASLIADNTKFPLGWLVRENAFTTDNIKRAADVGITQFCPLAGETTRKQVEEAHKYVSEVRAHGVKKRSDMKQVIETGCDGLTINWPDWLTH